MTQYQKRPPYRNCCQPDPFKSSRERDRNHANPPLPRIAERVGLSHHHAAFIHCDQASQNDGAYDPLDDINESVAEGLRAIRERKAAGGHALRKPSARRDGWGEPTDYPDMPDFLIRKPKVGDDEGRG